VSASSLEAYIDLRWHVGDVVRKLRTSVSWTLDDLAFHSGVSVQVIHRIEIGSTLRPRASTLDRIAQAFGLRYWHLLYAIPRNHTLEPSDTTPLPRPPKKKTLADE